MNIKTVNHAPLGVEPRTRHETLHHHSQAFLLVVLEFYITPKHKQHVFAAGDLLPSLAATLQLLLRCGLHSQMSGDGCRINKVSTLYTDWLKLVFKLRVMHNEVFTMDKSFHISAHNHPGQQKKVLTHVQQLKVHIVFFHEMHFCTFWANPTTSSVIPRQ